MDSKMGGLPEELAWLKVTVPNAHRLAMEAIDQRKRQERYDTLKQLEDEAAEDRIYLVNTDHLGTPQEVVSEDGKVVWLARYKAWGKVQLLDMDEVAQPWRFQGQYEDEETGLFYNRFRYYDPATARYLTLDPIKLAGGNNLYQYGSNSTAWIDPLGLAGNRANRRAGSILQDIDASGGGHAHSRHGAGTTLLQQEHRAVTGIPPDNPCIRRPRPVDSTRFLTNVDQLDAIQRGTNIMDANGTDTATFDMGRVVGEGYRAGGGCPQTTSKVTVVRRNGDIVTAYPQL